MSMTYAQWDSINQVLCAMEAHIDNTASEDEEHKALRQEIDEMRSKARSLMKEKVRELIKNLFITLSDDDLWSVEKDNAKEHGWSAEDLEATRQYLLGSYFDQLATKIIGAGEARIFGQKFKCFTRPDRKALVPNG
jgi:hypothetical protein